jgi:hypothetical protein
VRVETEIGETELEGDYGNMVDGLTVKCERCGHEVEVYGTSETSARRGAVMLAEECPKGEKNYYVADWE